MPSPGLRYFLILLVLWAIADDFLALATPDPADDVQATDNNVYSLTKSSTNPRRGAVEKESPACAWVASRDHFFLAVSQDRIIAAGKLGHFSLACLYVFMSLQR